MPDSSARAHVFPAHLALAAAQVAFALFAVFGVALFQPGGIPPLAVGAWRLVGGTTILGVIAALWYGRRAVPARAHLARFVVAAFLGVAINQGLFLEGLARSTPINATLVMCLIPVFTFTIAAAVGQEHFNLTRLVGVLVALGGTLPLLFADGFHTLGRYGLGNLLMVGNSLCYSGYLIIARPLVRRYPPIVVIAWAYILSLPFAPWFAWGVPLLPTRGAAWAALAYVIAFPTVIAYLLNVFALHRLGASTTAVYIYAQPLIAALASWVVYDETPTSAMIGAAAALFVGVWLVSRPRADDDEGNELGTEERGRPEIPGRPRLPA